MTEFADQLTTQPEADALVLSPLLMKARDLKRALARDLTRTEILGATQYHRGRDPSSVWHYSLGCSATSRAMTRVLQVGSERPVTEDRYMDVWIDR